MRYIFNFKVTDHRYDICSTARLALLCSFLPSKPTGLVIGDTDIATPTHGVHAETDVELVPAYRIGKDW